MSYEMRQLVHDIRALADALCMEEDKQDKIEFTHDSGFNSIQGKYSLVCDTRGLLIASEDYCEMKAYKAPTDSSDVRMRVNEFGDIVHPPEMPEPPKPIDTSKWVNITPLRREKLAKYKEDLESYEHQMEFYRIKMARWEALPFLDEGRTRDEFISDLVHALRCKPTFHGITFRRYYDYLNGTFEYEIPVFRYGKYRVFRDKKMVEKYTRSELPEWAVTRHEMEIVTPIEGKSWIKQDIYDRVWRFEEQERMRKELKQHRKKAQRERDTSVQLTLDGNCYNARDITKDILHNFTGDVELLWKFYMTSFEKRGCIHGSVDINEVCFQFSKEELDEMHSRIVRE